MNIIRKSRYTYNTYGPYADGRSIDDMLLMSEDGQLYTATCDPDTHVLPRHAEPVTEDRAARFMDNLRTSLIPNWWSRP